MPESVRRCISRTRSPWQPSSSGTQEDLERAHDGRAEKGTARVAEYLRGYRSGLTPILAPRNVNSQITPRGPRLEHGMEQITRLYGFSHNRKSP